MVLIGGFDRWFSVVSKRLRSVAFFGGKHSLVFLKANIGCSLRYLRGFDPSFFAISTRWLETTRTLESTQFIANLNRVYIKPPNKQS